MRTQYGDEPIKLKLRPSLAIEALMEGSRVMHLNSVQGIWKRPGACDIADILAAALLRGPATSDFIECEVPKDKAVRFIQQTEEMSKEWEKEAKPERRTERAPILRLRDVLASAGRNMVVYQVGPEGYNPVACATLKEIYNVLDGLFCDAPECCPVIITPETMDLVDVANLPEHAGW